MKVWVLSRIYGHDGGALKAWKKPPTWEQFSKFVCDYEGLEGEDADLDSHKKEWLLFWNAEIFDVYWEVCEVEVEGVS